MKIAAGAQPNAARILLVVGLFLLGLWIAGTVMITVSSEDPGPVLFMQVFIYLGLWLGLPVFALLAAAVALWARTREKHAAG
jgi:hypothetical protein